MNKAEEFRKKWLNTNDNHKKIERGWIEDEYLEFAEAYRQSEQKKAMKQIFDAYGIGFMGKAEFRHDFEAWYKMENKNF